MENRILETYRLLPHPMMGPNKVKGVTVEIIYSERDGDLLLTYIVSGAEHVKLPEWISPHRCDRLWETTCFELFVQQEGLEPYFEFNFSPSTQWSAYRFDRYREGMSDVPLVLDPHIDRGVDDVGYVIKVDFDLAPFADTSLRLGLSAVIEEKDGTKSYWALAHPPGKPDFHHKDCFALTLPAPSSA